jgi:hypothetical protein
MRLPGIQTIQGALEEAAAKIEGAPVEVIGAGRTDSGVHATGQVAHVNLSLDRPEKIADAMNFHLRPHPIAVLRAEQVSEEFHAHGFPALPVDAGRRSKAAPIAASSARIAADDPDARLAGVPLGLKYGLVTASSSAGARCSAA